MSADLTTEVWRQQWSDFPGGVGNYAPNGKPVEEAGGSLGPLSELESHWLKKDGIGQDRLFHALGPSNSELTFFQNI